ncbi:TonB-dependent receptor [Glacieibacterium sp.]|uniref:TonB-dependent receptor n=1 Tax=Glacieibacterium sp. TaxID=2860237 RepID=UPI003B001C9A
MTDTNKLFALPAFLALGCVGFIATDTAQAADAAADAADAARETIIVTGSAASHANVQADTPKAVAKLLDTPRSVVVLDKEVIKETGSATLVEALRTVPGITFGAAEGGNPIGDRPFIRGNDSQGSTYLDGVRDIGAQSREIFDVEQVQIVRGSDSTLGGRGSAGGSINIISKLPRDRNFAEVAVSYGTDDYKRVAGDVNYKIAEHVAVRLAGAWHDQDVAGRDEVFQKRWGFAPSITIGLGTPTRLTAAYYHLKSNELPDSGIPFLYTIGNTPNLGTSLSEPALGTVTTANGRTGKVDRSTFYGLVDRDFRKATTDQATLRAEHDFGGITLRNTSRYSHTNQSYIFTLPDDSTGNVYGTGQVWTRANTRYGYTDSLINQTDLYGKFDTGGIQHSFAVGVELSVEKARRGAYVTRGFTNAAGNELFSSGSTISPRCNPATVARSYCVDLFNPNPNAPWVNYASDTSNVAAPIVKTLAIAETQNDANTQAVYAFDSITLLPNLILNLGARYDSFASKITPGQPITATSTFSLKRTDNLFNYQVGAVFKPTATTSIYASYATSATPPNSLLGEGQEANALGTTATAGALAIFNSLKVEKSKSSEIGAKADLFDGQLSLTSAVFQTKTNNARVTIDANTVAFIGKRRIRGVELGFNGNIVKGWNVFGGYTYLDAKIVDGGFTSLAVAANGPGAPATAIPVISVNTGKQFPQTAKHSFTIWSNYSLFDKLTIGGGAFYSSRVFGGYSDNRTATQSTTGVITVNPATKVIERAVPSYWRFDARVGYKISDAIDLSVNVQNLTDKAYFSQAYASHYATIAAGRSAFGTVTVKY